MFEQREGCGLFSFEMANKFKIGKPSLTIKHVEVGPRCWSGQNQCAFRQTSMSTFIFMIFSFVLPPSESSPKVPTTEDNKNTNRAASPRQRRRVGTRCACGSGPVPSPLKLGDGEGEGKADGPVDEVDEVDDVDDDLIGAAEDEAAEESSGWFEYVYEEGLASFYNLTSGEGGITLASEDATFPGMLLLLASLNINRTGLVLASIRIDFGNLYNTLFGWIADVSMLDVNLPNAPEVGAAFTAIITILFAPLVWKRLEVLRHEQVGYLGEGSVAFPEVPWPTVDNVDHERDNYAVVVLQQAILCALVAGARLRSSRSAPVGG